MTQPINEEKPERSESKEALEIGRLQSQINELALVLEKMQLTEYISYLNNPRKLLLMNFAIGLVKGFGGAIGATVLLGIVVMFLKQMVLLNLPLIGGVIANLVELVNAHIAK